MSTFDDASLVFIPSGYKTSKAYSVKPSDGSGDLTFTRSNDTATRVNSAGLIEKVRTNTLTQSGTFSNAAWTKGNLTLTAGQTDPNGGTNAFLATSTGTSAVWFYQANTGAKTFSIYAKAGTKNFFSIINGTYNNGAGFNLSDQTVTNIGAGSLAKIESVGSGWYRCSVYVSTAVEMLVMLADTSGGSMIVGDTMTFAFAQSETGDIATDYIATTSAAVSVGPVANVPRLDYLNSSCPRLLLEPQRTNLAQYSEQFNNAWWEKVGGSFTANALTSPDGYTDADTFTENTSTSTHYFYNASGFTGTAAAYTGSVFAKAGTRSRLIMGIYDGTAANYQMVQFDLSAGTILQEASAGIAKIENYGNGWYRCSVTRTLTASTCYLSFGPHTNTNLSNLTVFPSYLGASGTLHFYGGQLELGAYATSYIPTLGAAVTRGADVASKTGISSLIGQTEGTLFFEGVYGNEAEEIYLFLQNGSASGADSSIYIQRASNSILFRVWNASSLDVSIIGGTFTVGQSIKIAAAYKANDFVLYVNGVQIGTDTSGAVPACARLQLASYFSDPTNNVYIARQTKQALLFKTRLTNAQLAELTTI